MVGRQRVVLGRERRAVLVRELLRVELHRQAVLARGVEHAPRLLAREADRVAERVDRIGESRARRRGKDVVAHGVDLGVRAPGELGRHRVRGEQRRAHVDVELRAQALRDGELSSSVSRSSP